MALFGKGGRTHKRVISAVVTVGTLGAFQALAVVGAVPAGAVLAGGCTYNPATQTVTVQQQSGDATEIGVLDQTAVPGGAANEIWITVDTGGAQDCGSATTSNTTGVVLLGSGVTNTNEIFQVNNSLTGGSFGAIAFSLDMGNSGVVPPGDQFGWVGSLNGSDNVKVTTTTFDANGGKGTLVGVEAGFYFLQNGNNVFDGTGTAIPLFVTAGTGSDTVTGGNANDIIDVGDAAVTPFYNQINAGSSRADGMDVYSGGVDFDIYDASTRTAVNWLSNNSLPNSGEGTCPGANPACEGDNINTDIDEMISGSGNDHLVAGAANTYLGGNAGDDNLDANSFTGVVVDNNTGITGGITIDPTAGTQTGGSGNDTLTNRGADGFGFAGGDGDDIFVYPTPSIAPFSSFCGAGGTDLVDASAQTSGRIINLVSGTYDGALNCGSPVPGSGDSTENVNGGSGDDTITGNTLRNELIGGDGNDVVLGSPAGTLNDAGDYLVGGLGNDSLFGGTGPDTASWKDSPSGETIDVSLGFADGGDGEDTILDLIEKITGSKFADNIKTGPTGAGSGLNFYVKALGGKDVVTGSKGNDTLAGGGGADHLLGSGGNDTLNGAGGNDWLYGEAGVDTGNGGDGKDRCIKTEINTSCGSKQHPKRPGLSTYAAVRGKLG